MAAWLQLCSADDSGGCCGRRSAPWEPCYSFSFMMAGVVVVRCRARQPAADAGPEASSRWWVLGRPCRSVPLRSSSASTFRDRHPGPQMAESASSRGEVACWVGRTPCLSLRGLCEYSRGHAYLQAVHACSRSAPHALVCPPRMHRHSQRHGAQPAERSGAVTQGQIWAQGVRRPARHARQAWHRSCRRK